MKFLGVEKGSIKKKKKKTVIDKQLSLGTQQGSVLHAQRTSKPQAVCWRRRPLQKLNDLLAILVHGQSRPLLD